MSEVSRSLSSSRPARQPGHETDPVAAVIKLFIIDRLVFGSVGRAFDQKDRAACPNFQGLAQRSRRPTQLQDGTLLQLESYFCSQLDLVLHIDDGLLPSHFQSERLYREDWMCAVAHDSGFGDSLSLKQYLSAYHIVVGTYASVHTIPDKQLDGYWSETQLVYSRAVLRRGPAMPPGHGTRADSNQWYDFRGQAGSQVTSRKGATGITRVSLLNGLASATKHRSSSRVASRGDAINNRGRFTGLRFKFFIVKPGSAKPRDLTIAPQMHRSC
jgi:hypothetical protein